LLTEAPGQGVFCPCTNFTAKSTDTSVRSTHGVPDHSSNGRDLEMPEQQTVTDSVNFQGPEDVVTHRTLCKAAESRGTWVKEPTQNGAVGKARLKISQMN
jgi:hypothetical protein